MGFDSGAQNVPMIWTAFMAEPPSCASNLRRIAGTSEKHCIEMWRLRIKCLYRLYSAVNLEHVHLENWRFDCLNLRLRKWDLVQAIFFEWALAEAAVKKNQKILPVQAVLHPWNDLKSLFIWGLKASYEETLQAIPGVQNCLNRPYFLIFFYSSFSKSSFEKYCLNKVPFS